MRVATHPARPGVETGWQTFIPTAVTHPRAQVSQSPRFELSPKRLPSHRLGYEGGRVIQQSQYAPLDRVSTPKPTSFRHSRCHTPPVPFRP